jgi:hypothetical protein
MKRRAYTCATTNKAPKYPNTLRVRIVDDFATVRLGPKCPKLGRLTARAAR